MLKSVKMGATRNPSKGKPLDAQGKPLEGFQGVCDLATTH